MTDSNMSDATSQGSSTTSGLAEAGRDTYEQVKSKAMEAMPRITEAARTQAMGQAETAKDALADTGERLAQSLRSALDGGDESVQAKLMAAAADTVADMSNSLRGRSFNELWTEADAFARRNPGAFVAAAALAGFAIARFARSSASSGQNASYGGSYGSSSYGSTSGTGAMSGSSMGSGMGTSSTGMGSGSGMGSGGGYAGSASFGVGTGSAYGAGRGMGGQVSTSGMSTHDDDIDEAGSIADDGLGGGTGGATPNSTADRSGSGYDR